MPSLVVRRPPVDPVVLIGSFPAEVPPTDLPEVAFAGRSNVGKSSALNALLNQRGVARVSRTPGRTQLINLFRINDRLVFTDLPGYGFAKVPGEIHAGWKGMIETYLAEREELCLIVVFVDCRHEAQPLDLDLVVGLREAELPHVVVATKVDKLTRNARKGQLSKLARGLGVAPEDLLPFSSQTMEGVEDLWRMIQGSTKARTAT
jgi:GTP-binding protein